MGRPPTLSRPMTNAERQDQYRERRGRGPDLTAAARMARWRAKRWKAAIAKVVERFTGPTVPPVTDPLLAEAQSALESQGGTVDEIRQLHAVWPRLDQRVREILAEGEIELRLWLRPPPRSTWW
jgi:hypothetical protein